MFKIFYSWQSDLPGKANRYLIQRALEGACKAIKTDGGIIAEAVVERDTLGLPGAPNVVDAVLSKIRDCDVVVADVSFINLASRFKSEEVMDEMRDEEKAEVNETYMPTASFARPSPNPNVLFELGYAMSQLGNQALVLVVNTFYGPVESLPFDLRGLRVMPYYANPEGALSSARTELQQDFVSAIRSIAGVARGDPVDSILYERTRNVAGQARGLFFDMGRAAAVIGQSLTEDEINRMFDELTEQICLKICLAINPNSEAPLFVSDQRGGGRKANWLEHMAHWRNRSKKFFAQAMELSPFVKREHAALLMRVEYCSYFAQIDLLGSEPIQNATLEWVAPILWKYFECARSLANYAERELARRATTF